MGQQKCYLCKKTSKKNANLTFHKFPKDLSLCEKWKKACGIQESHDVTGVYLCSNHFHVDTKRQFPVKGKRPVIKLMSGSVPSICVPFPPQFAYLVTPVDSTPIMHVSENNQYPSDTSIKLDDVNIDNQLSNDTLAKTDDENIYNQLSNDTSTKTDDENIYNQLSNDTSTKIDDVNIDNQLSNDTSTKIDDVNIDNQLSNDTSTKIDDVNIDNQLSNDPSTKADDENIYNQLSNDTSTKTDDENIYNQVSNDTSTKADDANINNQLSNDTYVDCQEIVMPMESLSDDADINYHTPVYHDECVFMDDDIFLDVDPLNYVDDEDINENVTSCKKCIEMLNNNEEDINGNIDPLKEKSQRFEPLHINEIEIPDFSNPKRANRALKMIKTENQNLLRKNRLLNKQNSYLKRQMQIYKDILEQLKNQNKNMKTN